MLKKNPEIKKGNFLTIKSTAQSSTQQQKPGQPQPATTPKNTTIAEPVATLANVTQPTQKAFVPQISIAEVLGFPSVVVFGVALGLTIALMTVGYVVHGHRLAS